MKTAAVHSRIQPEIKEQAEEILQRLGLSPTEAIRMFYTQITLRNGLPFDVAIPNDETIKALEDSRNGRNLERFNSAEELFKSWDFMKVIFQTSQFKRDFKRIRKRGKDLVKLKEIIGSLANGEALEERLRDHALGGKWTGSRDCHIEPDWILIYRVDEENLFLERTGSHSDLFR